MTRAGEVADDPNLLVGTLAYTSYVPKLIDILVTDEEQKRQTFEIYANALEALKQQRNVT